MQKCGNQRHALHFCFVPVTTKNSVHAEIIAFAKPRCVAFLDYAFQQEFSEAAKRMGFRKFKRGRGAHGKTLMLRGERFGSSRMFGSHHVIVFDEAGLRRILKDYFEALKIIERTSRSTKMHPLAGRSSFPR